MRDFKGMKRQRGRNRKPGGGNANAANPNRSWDSQGPENIKVRGNAQTVYERYQQLARDAASSGDRVLAENYLQHAEHYFRVLRALQPQRPVSEIAARELSNQGFDIDFEDETGAQAAAFLAAAQQQAEREARQQAEAEQRENREPREPREPREWRDRDQNQNREQNREWQPREPREPRGEGEPRAEGEARPEGGRRETRRERWERRREERNRRFQAEGGVGEAPDDRGSADQGGGEFDDAPPVISAPAETVAEETPVREERPARRTRAPRAEQAATDDAGALPGFLTRSAAPAPAAAADGEEPAPKKRAPRARKVEPAEE